MKTHVQQAQGRMIYLGREKLENLSVEISKKKNSTEFLNTQESGWGEKQQHEATLEQTVQVK